MDNGFADTVDYIKLQKTSSADGLRISFSEDYEENTFSIEVLDKNGNLKSDYTFDIYKMMAAEFEDDYHDLPAVDISKWANGTYYLKVTVASDSCVYGCFYLDDHF